MERSDEDLRDWIGRTEVREDEITAAPLAALAAALDREESYPKVGNSIPPLSNWLYFLPLARQSALADDGHEKRGGFLPPVSLPRRMFAGGRLVFHKPLRVGQKVSRESRIADVASKTGQTGPLVFVKVQHEISSSDGLAITQFDDLVYREKPKPGEAPAPFKLAPDDAEWTVRIVPNEVLLFRYSALTFNGHRIHYDRSYATEAEGYPGLVVHGPLIATLLMNLARDKAKEEIAEFSFRAVRPLFDVSPFMISGKRNPNEKSIKLWAADAEGKLAMEASVVVR